MSAIGAMTAGLAKSADIVRGQFEYFNPAHGYPAFMENAGGSQVPRCVPEAMAAYMQHSYAQLGAGHLTSDRATATVEAAREWMRVVVNAPQGVGEVMLGSSSSQMLCTLAGIYGQVLGPGDEVVVQESGHEANINPWLRMAKVCGATVKWWLPDLSTSTSVGTRTDEAICYRCNSRLSDLEALLGPRTKVVAVIHVSNLLGEVQDLQGIMQTVRRQAPHARVVVDGVAFAPHRLLDMQAWGVDWYVFSNYKVYGPHMATLFGSAEAIKELLDAGAEGPNHYFVAPSDFAYKFELGGVNHEGCAGLLALQQYYKALAGLSPPGNSHTDSGGTTLFDAPNPTGCQTPPPAGYRGPAAGGCCLSRAEVEQAYVVMHALEQPLADMLGSFLSQKPGVVLLGPASPPPGGAAQAPAATPMAATPASTREAATSSVAVSVPDRVPTFSFVHRQLGPKQIVKELQARGFAVRWGHMYAKRLVEACVEHGIIPEGPAGGSAAAVEAGVVRISLLHYNTVQEVEALMQALDSILCSPSGTDL